MPEIGSVVLYDDGDGFGLHYFTLVEIDGEYAVISAGCSEEYVPIDELIW